jgi:hypothetical protein
MFQLLNLVVKKGNSSHITRKFRIHDMQKKKIELYILHGIRLKRINNNLRKFYHLKTQISIILKQTPKQKYARFSFRSDKIG